MKTYAVMFTQAGTSEPRKVATTASYVLAMKAAQEWQADNPEALIEIMCHSGVLISPWKVWDLGV